MLVPKRGNSFIHLFSIPICSWAQGRRGAWNLSQQSLGKCRLHPGEVTNSSQVHIGKKSNSSNSHSHWCTMWSPQLTSHACFWIVGGIRWTRREAMQTQWEQAKLIPNFDTNLCPRPRIKPATFLLWGGSCTFLTERKEKREPVILGYNWTNCCHMRTCDKAKGKMKRRRSNRVTHFYCCSFSSDISHECWQQLCSEDKRKWTMDAAAKDNTQWESLQREREKISI